MSNHIDDEEFEESMRKVNLIGKYVHRITHCDIIISIITVEVAVT